MVERRSSESDNFNQLSDEDKLTTSPFLVQQCSSSTVSAASSSEKWIGSIQIGPSMRLNDCMNFTAKVCGIRNPMDGYMQRVLGRISTNMTNDLLNDMLDDYANLFRIRLKVISFADNQIITSDQISTFTGASGVSEKQGNQYFVVIMHNYKHSLFAPLYVIRIDGSRKVCFDDNDDESICKEICDFICKWNNQKSQDATSEMSNINNNNAIINNSKSYNTRTIDGQVPSTSVADKDVFIPASQVIQNSLQVVSHLLTQIDSQLDHIQFRNKSTYAWLNDFNCLSDNDKMGRFNDEIITISEVLRIAGNPSHEEEVEDASSMKIEDNLYFVAPSDMKNNHHIKTVPVDRSLSSQIKPYDALKRPRKTEDMQIVSMLLRQYVTPKVLREPSRYQHVRMFSELAAGICPLIQAGNEDALQQTYIEIGVPNEDGTELHVGVRAVTMEKGQHPHKSAVPQKPPIDISSMARNGERSCLKCDKNDFDPNLEYMYLPISDEERVHGRKEILAHLINWKRLGVGRKNRVVNENLHLCKLEFYLCVRTGPGEYHRVSPSFYSSIIEEGDGPVNIKLEAVQLQQLCERGGQIINLLLSTGCPKRGFRVLYNGKNLDDTKFKIHQKQLLIISPSQTSNNTNLHLKIFRNEYDDEIEDNTERTLYDHTFNYVSHDNQPSHICSQQSFILGNIKT